MDESASPKLNKSEEASKNENLDPRVAKFYEETYKNWEKWLETGIFIIKMQIGKNQILLQKKTLTHFTKMKYQELEELNQL